LLSAAPPADWTGAPGGSRNGDLGVAYDAGGNLIRMVVHRDGTCLPSGLSCVQRFDYQWNEVGQLSHARRWDLSVDESATFGEVSVATSPVRVPDAELSYAYDASGQRTLKTALDPAGNSRHTLYVFASLEIRSATFDNEATTPDYVVDRTTEQVRLSAGVATARVIYSDENLPEPSGSHRHLFLEFADQVGSTNFVVDHATGELVEFATYGTYGAAESDYRPPRWSAYREPYRFGGKEEDIEVGLQYFGARYYSPNLGVWTSADPTTIHSLGSETNPYAYVHGTPIAVTDRDGRIFPLAAIAIGLAVGALIGAGSSVAYQTATVGWSHINWGIHGVVGAAIVGGVAGAVSGGVGAWVSGAIAPAGSGTGAAAAGSLMGGLAAGATGGATSYVMSCALAQQKMNIEDFSKSMGVGAAMGFGFGALSATSLGLSALDRATAPTAAEAAQRAAERGVAASIAEGALVSVAQAGAAYAFLTAIGAPKGVAVAGAISAGVNGAFAGARGTYNWSSPSGYFAAAQDATVGLVGTTLGNVSNLINIGVPVIGVLGRGAEYEPDQIYRQNRQVYKGGFGFQDYALTQGNVTSNWEGHDTSLLNDHELLHTWQSRTFGPLYQATYVAWFVGGALTGAAYSAVGGQNFFNSVMAAGYASNPFEGAAYHQQGYHPSDRMPGNLLMWP